MKYRIDPFTTIMLLITLFLLAGCSGCSVKNAEQTPIEAEQQDTANGYWHDGHWHPAPDTTEPIAPENDTFFESIVFPDKPQLSADGHYRPKNPFEIPNVIKDNPHLFVIHENGYWSVNETEELFQKWSQVQGEFGSKGITEQAYRRKLAEALSEGLDPLVGALFIAAKHVSNDYAKELVDKAYAQNPNDYEVLIYWCMYHSLDNPDEVKATYLRMLQTRPDDIRILYSLGQLILENEDTPREAIPYLEKAYQLKPDWADPILILGQVYFELREFEKSLRYFQGFQRFAGNHPGVASTRIALIRIILAKQNKGIAIQ